MPSHPAARASRTAIVKILHSVGYRHDLYRAFSDSMEMIAIALCNNVDRAQREEREARYMEVIKRYNKTEVVELAHILPHLVMAFEDKYDDHLGQIFMELELGSDTRGQFFTPYALSYMMAELQMDDRLHDRIEQNGFVTVSDPALGAGSMLIGFAQAMRSRGLNFQTQCHATGVDVDIKSIHMAYIQLSILGMPAVLVHGNSLSLKEWDHWYTPFHIIGGWDRKLRRGHVEDSENTLINVPLTLNPVPAVPQLELFT